MRIALPWTRSFRRTWIVLLLCGTMQEAAAQRSTFSIIKGDNVVGSILIARIATGDKASYVITSYAELDLVWKQVVRTSMRVDYVGGDLTGCHTAVRVNNGLRDSSHMELRNGAAMCYVHPDAPFPYAGGSRWTTARMYFEEPVDQPSIFVESVMKDCPLRKTGANTYTLTFPNKNVNRYVYDRGVLQEIQVDRPLLDLVFRRS